MKFQPASLSGASMYTRIVDGGDVEITELMFSGTFNCLPNMSVICMVPDAC